MSLKTSRIAALAATLAAAGAMSVATTSASALTITAQFRNWELSGTLTPTKFPYPAIPLPAGSTFNGEANITLLPFIPRPATTGTVTGAVAIPPFTWVFGPTGLKITPTVPVSGTMVEAPVGGCTGAPGCVELKLLTELSIEITTGIFAGCRDTPVRLPLEDELTLTELVTLGAHFKGKTNVPLWAGCTPAFWDLVLDGGFSSPPAGDLEYSLSITPP
jgi:hypothetical protein